ncbi:MAG: type II secretion system F family protein, partial [Armatimonadetes bacterium]|nr:type II secretion system F family protein [Armatimonadota bacterium]
SLGLETRRTGEFPSLLSQMMLVGEETGDVEGALNTVSDALDVEVANALRGLVALVEPVIILLMGVAVAVVVFAMLMPIFQMNAGIA